MSIVERLDELKEFFIDLKDNPIFSKSVEEAISLIVNTYKDNKKFYVAGNGTSASDANDIALRLLETHGEGYMGKGYPVISLCTNPAILTAMANDEGGKYVFASQLRVLGNQGDLYIGISTSGNSENIIQGASVAKEKGIKILGLTGKTGGLLDDYCDVNIIVPTEDTREIQVTHRVVLNYIAEKVKQELYSQNQTS